MLINEIVKNKASKKSPNNFNGAKLGPKLFVFTASIIIITLLMGLFASQRIINKGLDIQFERTLSSNLAAITESITRDRLYQQGINQTIASTSFIRAALDKNISQDMDNELKRLMSNYSKINYLLLLDRERNIFAINSADKNKKAIAAEFLQGKNIDQYALTHTAFNHLSFITPPTLDPLLAKLGTAVFNSQWLVTPVSARGQIVGWVIASYQWQQAIEEILSNKKMSLIEIGLEVVGIALLGKGDQLLAGELQQANNTYYSDSRAVDINMAARPVKLLIQYKTAPQQETSHKLTRELGLILAPLFLLLVATLYCFLVWQVLRPIMHLKKAVMWFAGGDYSYRLAIQGQDEIAELMVGFNSMAACINDACDNLEANVVLRTKELSQLNEQLKYALIEAEKSTQAKNTFLASMSHEIRTPMNGVLGMLRLLEQGDLQEEQRHKAGLAILSAESLLHLINDILDFSKISAGKLELDKVDFDLIDSVWQLTQSLALSAQSKGLVIMIDCLELIRKNQHELRVYADPYRINQIFTNLISNAIKFTEQGEITIKLDVEQAESLDGLPQIKLIAMVRDTGVGINADKKDQLFNSFAQQDASTTRNYGGTGLGLAIVKQLCQLMQGDIRGEANDNQGSSFIFELLVESPAYYESANVSWMGDDQLPANNADIYVSAIILDDHPVRRQQLQQELFYLGIQNEISNAEDFEAVLEHLQSARIVILLDVALLVQVEARLAVLKQSKLLYVVTLSDLTETRDFQYFHERGVSNHLFRPYQPKQLIDVIYTEKDLTPKACSNTDIGHTLLPGQDPRLLLVEDNKINQEVAAGILENLGYHVDVADNGQVALEMLKQKQDFEPVYSVILMDCQMPLMDGYQATRAIRAGESRGYDNIPIIAMTANAMVGDEEACLAAGMNDYLTKPMDPNLIQEKLSKWLLNNDEYRLSLNVWDEAKAIKRLGGERDFLQRLATLFIKEAPLQLAQIKQGVQKQNYEAVFIPAHSLKGTAGNFCTMFFEQACSDFIVELKQENWQELMQIAEQLEEIYRGVAAELEKFIVN